MKHNFDLLIIDEIDRSLFFLACTPEMQILKYHSVRYQLTCTLPLERSVRISRTSFSAAALTNCCSGFVDVSDSISFIKSSERLSEKRYLNSRLSLCSNFKNN